MYALAPHVQGFATEAVARPSFYSVYIDREGVHLGFFEQRQHVSVFGQVVLHRLGRGASEARIFWRDVLRNSLLPAITMAGLLFGELVGGAVVTETVFGRAGLGSLTVNAVSSRDTPVLLGVVLIAATAYVVINLIVDLLYPVLDVRLRDQATAETADTPATTAKEAVR